MAQARFILSTRHKRPAGQNLLTSTARLPTTTLVIEMLKTRKYGELREYLGRVGIYSPVSRGISSVFYACGIRNRVPLGVHLQLMKRSYGAEDLVSVRRHLVDNGLVSEQEFAMFLKRGIKPGRRSTIERKNLGKARNNRLATSEEPGKH